MNIVPALKIDDYFEKIKSWFFKGVEEDVIFRQLRVMGYDKDRVRRVIDAVKKDISPNEVEFRINVMIAQLKQRKATLKDEYIGTPAGIKALNEIDDRIAMLERINFNDDEGDGGKAKTINIQINTDNFILKSDNL